MLSEALVVLLALIGGCFALRSSMTYVPQGSNPLLYQPGVDPIMALDQATFSETVFEPSRTSAFFVEFYADWCGHCRAFAPFFRDFASLVSNWGDVVRVAAVNCADNFNGQICRANGVSYFPMLKYFPRSSSNVKDAMLVEAAHSGSNLRDQLSGKVVNEFNQNHYMDWPNLDYIVVNGLTRFEDLWQGTLPSANFLLIIFEQFESVAAQMILDMVPYKKEIGVRRALSTSPLVDMLKINTFPYVAMFRKGEQQSIFMDMVRQSTPQDVLSRVHPGETVTSAPVITTTTKRPDVINCEGAPERCKNLYFVSETDMLKAMHQALVDEVTRSEYIAGQNFANLYNFVSLLSEYFPVISFSTENGDRRLSARNKRSVTTVLKRSERALLVFKNLKAFLEQKPGIISANEWHNQFQSVERVYSFPFPVNATWQHCRGTSPEYRGYTCGLWTTFHAVTVNTYLDNAQLRKVNPLMPLKAIQGWVHSFFGCEDCKQHFMNMTTHVFPMNERRVRHIHDMVMYLWRAHNIVNNRLHGDITEDPQFLKFQFPPFFLCPTCNVGGQFSRRQVRNFLIHYYSNIKPHHRIHSLGSSAAAVTN